MLIPEWVIQLIGMASVAASTTTVIFVFLGKKWISHLFSKELEKEKAELNEQLEHEKAKLSARTEQAKSEISFHAAKRLSLHNKEYEVFPEIWSRLSDARDSLGPYLIEFRLAPPDLNRMGDDDFKKWLGRTDLEDDEKNEMLKAKADDRESQFNQIRDFQNLIRAQKAFLEFDTYLQKNRIFISPEIREKLDYIGDCLKKPWAERQTHFDLEGKIGGANLRVEAINILIEEVKPLMLEIENIIQEKFFAEMEKNSQ